MQAMSPAWLLAAAAACMQVCDPAPHACPRCPPTNQANVIVTTTKHTVSRHHAAMLLCPGVSHPRGAPLHLFIYLFASILP